MKPIVDALLAAGGVPRSGDPLFPLTQGRPKALLEIAGRPMVQYVLDALSAATSIRSVVVIGLTPETHPEAAALTCARPLSFLPGQGSLVDNLAAAGAWAQSLPTPPTHLLATSSDIPLLTATMVDWNVATSLETDHDAYYNLVPRAVMEARFPGVRRTYFRLRDGVFCGADLNLLSLTVLNGYNPAWRRIIDSRKNVLAQAQLVGFDVLLLGALGLLPVTWAQDRIRARLGVRGRVLICPHAEAGMDVDRPDHLAVVTQALSAAY
ncbi:MAG: NTP transferase domain-containing protein [Anaerolineales bacterium]|nr:NTP transferase domain-containing protein [Anaerolineales bacterium]